jgi:hypothetical protein
MSMFGFAANSAAGTKRASAAKKDFTRGLLTTTRRRDGIESRWVFD